MESLFITITRNENEEQLDFYRRVAAEITSRAATDAWANSTVVVNEGYESPYFFGRKLRDMCGDYNAAVHRFHTVDHKPLYVVFSRDAVVYDPAQRTPEQSPVDLRQVDYFSAVDGLSE